MNGLLSVNAEVQVGGWSLSDVWLRAGLDCALE